MDSKFALAFVGPVVPDEARFHGPAFSRAGVMALTNMLAGMSQAGLRPSRILSFVPVPAFPRSSRLWCGEQSTTIAEGLGVSFVPFVNVPLIKQLMLGIGTALYLVKWGWDSRRAPRKVVFVFNLSTPSGLLVLAAARLVGAVAVVWLNDVNKPGETVSNSALRHIDYAVQRWLIPRFDGHVTVADAIMQDFAPSRRFLRIEGGIAAERFDAARQVSRGDRRPFTLVAAGSLDKANGVDVLLEAMRLLEEPNVRLLIAGDGQLAGLVREAAAKDSRIEYCGYLSFGEVLALYAEANLLLNLRMTKAIQTRYFFPSKLMEYLASGAPVLTTRTGSVADDFGDAALFLDDETPAGLAQRLTEIMAMPPSELAQLGERARARMLATKTWSAQSRKVVAYLNELVEAQSSDFKMAV